MGKHSSYSHCTSSLHSALSWLNTNQHNDNEVQARQGINSLVSVSTFSGAILFKEASQILNSLFV